MPYMETLFYITLLGQIFLLSYHYPMKYVRRIQYIMDHYPAKDYPSLYPSDIYVHSEDVTRKRVTVFKYMNFSIGIFGLVIIAFAIASGFTLNEKGGAEIFVMMYFILQFIPHFLLEIQQYKHNKHMQKILTKPKRSAELTPRNLADFISPVWVIFAALLFAFNTFLFLYFEGFDQAWDVEIYISIGVTVAVHIGFIVIGYNIMKGQKANPLQAHSDQMTTIRATITIMVYSSIMMSSFLIAIHSAREFELDKWEPIMMSIFFQLTVFFGIGAQLRAIKVEDVDFEVYKVDPKAKPA